MCMCVFKFLSEITEPTDKVHVGPQRDRGKIYSNDSGQLSFFILILPASRGGAFSGDFTTNLARQCRAFSRALKIEKLKAPLFRGPEGAGASNDWCIKKRHSTMSTQGRVAEEKHRSKTDESSHNTPWFSGG